MAMKKFINEPGNLVNELLEGFALANQRTVALAANNLVVRAHPKPKDRVALVTLGGSGHEPALSGFVGEGMLDISVPGEIFAAPGPPRVLEAIRMAARDAGVLFVVLNHAGDVMSANIVMDMLQSEGIKVKQILTHEDISGGPRDKPEDRRGLVGCLPVIKVAGAAAEQGKSLDECLAIAERMERNMATLAVAVAGATHPCTGDAIAEIPDGVMIVGMGQHGEAGGGTQNLKSADETAEIMLNALLDDLDVKSGEELLVLLNGVGATTLMELYLVLRAVKRLLEAKGIKLARAIAGEFLTVQEMAGFQMCVARMDAELLALWDAPCCSPALTFK
ncbi:MAG TPA: dihydroxyacetone kinase subunit DhaK [Candidatus Hydrogenedentes bacterium]|nr:dihydroxyacetone kinase subunit DhaK [Candidatus Hydrogenedentota bacterium]HPC17985.1 dihydroxyacetone kinase subunit DhaK [Candidatus Hydrogenedentota bacterium]HRT21680.1 dihydroxyacetone kinase subunit DhaK [Candidatus Hydrogenedentota bacterium]HRT66444.1 dihydroxyacetone kinase subunit DhaK [Candidatus Hydrogenedentota bacterium]